MQPLEGFEMKIHTAMTAIMAFLAMMGSIVLVHKFASNPGTLDDERVQYLWGVGVVTLGIALAIVWALRGRQWGLIACTFVLTGFSVIPPDEDWLGFGIMLVLTLACFFVETYKSAERNFEPNLISVLENAFCMWLPLSALQLVMRFSLEAADSLVILVVVGVMSIMLTPNRVQAQWSDSGRRTWAKPTVQ